MVRRVKPSARLPGAQVISGKLLRVAIPGHKEVGLSGSAQGELYRDRCLAPCVTCNISFPQTKQSQDKGSRRSPENWDKKKPVPWPQPAGAAGAR